MVTLTVNLSNESASRLFAKDPLRMTDLSGCGLSASASSHLRHNPVTLGIYPFLPCQRHLAASNTRDADGLFQNSGETKKVCFDIDSIQYLYMYLASK